MTTHSLPFMVRAPLHHSLQRRLEQGDGVIDPGTEDRRRAALAGTPGSLGLVLFFVGYALILGMLVAPSDWLRPVPPAQGQH